MWAIERGTKKSALEREKNLLLGTDCTSFLLSIAILFENKIVVCNVREAREKIRKMWKRASAMQISPCTPTTRCQRECRIEQGHQRNRHMMMFSQKFWSGKASEDIFCFTNLAASAPTLRHFMCFWWGDCHFCCHAAISSDEGKNRWHLDIPNAMPSSCESYANNGCLQAVHEGMGTGGIGGQQLVYSWSGCCAYIPGITEVGTVVYWYYCCSQKVAISGKRSACWLDGGVTQVDTPYC